MNPTGPESSGNSASNDLGQLPSRREGPPFSLLDDPSGDPSGPPFLAVSPDHLCQAFCWKLMQQLPGRGPAPGPIHPHVERAFEIEAEPPARIVQLQRRNPEIEKDSRNLGEVQY
jgi:hypothetical protein